MWPRASDPGPAKQNPPLRRLLRRLGAAAVEGGAEVCSDVRLLRRRWRELIKRINEVDPLVWPHCGAEMRVIAIILDHEVTDTILRHLARKEAERDRARPGCLDGEDASQ